MRNSPTKTIVTTQNLMSIFNLLQEKQDYIYRVITMVGNHDKQLGIVTQITEYM